MSFETELLAITDEGAGDIRAVVRRCFYVDFDGYPVRLWEGQGRLFTTMSVGNPATLPDGKTLAQNEWLGTIDADGTWHLSAPAVGDTRDGTSPAYDFTLPFIDRETYLALKADQALAAGRQLTCYRALFKVGEGLRPKTPIAFAWRMLMVGTTFAEGLQEGDAGSAQRFYTASVTARSLEYGRSRTPAGSWTDTAQRERARVLGVANDSGCIFMAKNASRTFTIEGD